MDQPASERLLFRDRASNERLPLRSVAKNAIQAQGMRAKLELLTRKASMTAKIEELEMLIDSESTCMLAITTYDCVQYLENN